VAVFAAFIIEHRSALVGLVTAALKKV